MLNLIDRLFQRRQVPLEPNTEIGCLLGAGAFALEAERDTTCMMPCIDGVRADILTAENLRVAELDANSAETIALCADNRVIEVK